MSEESEALYREQLVAVVKVLDLHMDLMAAVGSASHWVQAAAVSTPPCSSAAVNHVLPAVDEAGHQLDVVDICLEATVSDWAKMLSTRGPLGQWWLEALAPAVTEARVRGRNPIPDTPPTHDTLPSYLKRDDGHLVGCDVIGRLSATYEKWAHAFNEASALLYAGGWGESTGVYGTLTYQHAVAALDSTRAAYRCVVDATFRPLLVRVAATPGEMGPHSASKAIAMWMRALEQGGVDTAGRDAVTANLERELGEVLAAARAYKAADEG
ncbi:hypothetical protein ABQE62_07225 [Mycolicibacterium fortuitum]